METVALLIALLLKLVLVVTQSSERSPPVLRDAAMEFKLYRSFATTEILSMETVVLLTAS